MDPERYQKVKNLCQSALDIEQGMREAYLREACAGDESLRKEVEALLAHQTEAGASCGIPPWSWQRRSWRKIRQTCRQET